MRDDETPMQTQDPDRLVSLVAEVDPKLEFIRDLSPAAPKARTFLVREQIEGQADEMRVLRMRFLSTNLWDDTYFLYELHALRRAEERGLANVVRLVREYRSDDYHALLKTRVEGTPINTLDHERLRLDPAFITKLDALYRELHLAGIARIHFQPRKFVLAPSGELVLVDLNTCVVNTEVGILMFCQEMRADSRFITRLERRARKAAKRQRNKTS